MPIELSILAADGQAQHCGEVKLVNVIIAASW
jgi:hypothetical protein